MHISVLALIYGKKILFVSTGKILRGRKLKFMFGSVFAYVLVLGGLGEGRGGEERKVFCC